MSTENQVAETKLAKLDWTLVDGGRNGPCWESLSSVKIHGAKVLTYRIGIISAPSALSFTVDASSPELLSAFYAKSAEYQVFASLSLAQLHCHEIEGIILKRVAESPNQELVPGLSVPVIVISENGWILCSEALPDVGTKVLVLVRLLDPEEKQVCTVGLRPRRISPDAEGVWQLHIPITSCHSILAWQPFAPPRL